MQFLSNAILCCTCVFMQTILGCRGALSVNPLAHREDYSPGSQNFKNLISKIWFQKFDFKNLDFKNLISKISNCNILRFGTVCPILTLAGLAFWQLSRYSMSKINTSRLFWPLTYLTQTFPGFPEFLKIIICKGCWSTEVHICSVHITFFVCPFTACIDYFV